MAKVIGPLHSSEARGSVSSLTYNTWRGISTVKTRTGPTTQYSDAQVDVRNKARLATMLWQTRSDAERDAWNDYAANHVDIDWTGNPQRLSGYNWFVRINVRTQLCGFGFRATPPDVLLNTSLLTVASAGSPNWIDITWTIPDWNPPADLHVEIYGTHAHSVGSNPSIKMAHRITNVIHIDHYYAWTPLDPGWYTMWLRPIHKQGVTAGWFTTRAEATAP